MRSPVTFLMIVLAGFISLPALAGDDEFAVNRISPLLLKGANAVTRIDQERFVVRNTSEAVYYRRLVVTILNESGQKHASMTQFSNSWSQIRAFEGVLYDADGEIIRKLKKKEVVEESATEGSLAADARVHHHSFSHRQFPYTVEYEVEIKYNGTLFYPDWHPQSTTLMAIEQSTFDLVAPVDYKIRYKLYQGAPEPQIKDEKSLRTYTWKLTGLRAISSEVYAPGLRNLTPLVLVGPTDFEIHGYKGNMNDWKSFGAFTYQLNKDRDELPANVKQEIQRISAQFPDAHQKVKALYRYMQQNTRYISIQLGIGGWQPLDAKFVADKKYGDCKALSNFMFAILKEAGMKSNYALIRAGEERDIRADFPSQQFNHAILCVPLPSDTIWLECTDQDAAAGYMGSFTGNRYALLVDQAGGTLVRTPTYAPSQNLQVRQTKAVVDEKGNVQLQLSTLYTGIQQDHLQNLITSLERHRIREELQERFDFATYHIRDFKYRQLENEIPGIEETLDMEVSNYATITGKRLYIQPNLVSKYGRKLPADTSRRFPIALGEGWIDTDTVVYTLAPGYSRESIPADATFTNKFGEYSSSILLDGNTLTYYRRLQINGGQYPATDYNELVDFYEKIYRADRSKIVLVKKE